MLKFLASILCYPINTLSLPQYKAVQVGLVTSGNSARKDFPPICAPVCPPAKYVVLS